MKKSTENFDALYKPFAPQNKEKKTQSFEKARYNYPPAKKLKWMTERWDIRQDTPRRQPQKKEKEEKKKERVGLMPREKNRAVNLNGRSASQIAFIFVVQQQLLRCTPFGLVRYSLCVISLKKYLQGRDDDVRL